MLQLLTPTGARPIAWSLCERWAMAQTYRGLVRWIIVDDGAVPQPIEFFRPGWAIEVIRPRPSWREGQNTQPRNLLAGLDTCDPRHPVVCFEDDDFYAPGWLNVVTGHLAAAELVGSSQITYYNVRTRRWRRMANTTHAAMSCTALRDGALLTLRHVLARGERFPDAALWHAHPSRHLFVSSLVVSIKGLPGRPGIGRGHLPTFGTEHDADGSVLRQLIGEDAAAVYDEALADAAVMA